MMGAGRIVHLAEEKKSGVKWMIKIVGFIQIVHLSKEKKKGRKVNSTSCNEKKKGVEQIVQVI